MKRIHTLTLVIFLLLAVSCRKEGEASKREQRSTFKKLEGKWLMTEFYGSSYFNDMHGIETTSFMYTPNVFTKYTHESGPFGSTYDTMVVDPYTLQLEFTDYEGSHQRLTHIETLNDQGNVTVTERSTDWKEAKEENLFITLYGFFNYKITFVDQSTLKLTRSSSSSSPGASSSGTSTVVFVKM